MVIADRLHLVYVGEIVRHLANEECAQLTLVILAELLMAAHLFAEDFRFAGERTQLVALMEVTFLLFIISGFVLKQRSLPSEMILHASQEHIRIGSSRLLCIHLLWLNHIVLTLIMLCVLLLTDYV